MFQQIRQYQQGGQPQQEQQGQQEQIMQMIGQMLQQGMPPEQIAQNLVEQGMPQEQAMQAIQMVMQQMQQGEQEAPQQEEQMEAPQMQRGGMSFKPIKPNYNFSMMSKGDTTDYNTSFNVGLDYLRQGKFQDKRNQLNQTMLLNLDKPTIQYLGLQQGNAYDDAADQFYDPKRIFERNNQFGYDKYKQNIKKKFQEGGRLVDNVPQGYNFLKEDGNKKYYNKLDGQNLPQASGSGSGGADYENFLRSKLQSGISPQQLAEKRYISPSAVNKYQSLYKPSEDIVYTQLGQQPPVQQDAPAYGRSGQPVYNSNRHIAGEIFYPNRNSQGRADSGVLNTSQQPARFKFRNDFGFTGEETDLNADEIQNYLGTTNTFGTDDLYQQLKQRTKTASTASTKMKKGGKMKRNPYY